ncbi:MAG: phosphocholine cytidylyltransferase family protein [Acidobacteriota bacterium]
MRAVILAAGAGTRLNPLTNGCPKCLVDVGGRLLIDYQLEALSKAGVEDIALVVGFEAEQIRRYCGTQVRYIDNPDYATTNSIYSLHLAAAEFDTDTFLFNCDIIFHAEMLTRMLDSGHPNVVAVDSQAERVPREMNVSFDMEGRVSAISKELDPARAQGVSVQLVKFDACGADQVRQEVARLVAQQRRDVFPPSAYGILIQAGSLYAVDAGDLAWGEIDSLEDYARVVHQVQPCLGKP